MPLKVFSWKFLNSWRKPATLNVKACGVIFHADFVGVDRLRIELQVADQRLRAGRRGEGTIGGFSAERSRLKPPAL